MVSTPLLCYLCCCAHLACTSTATAAWVNPVCVLQMSSQTSSQQDDANTGAFHTDQGGSQGGSEPNNASWPGGLPDDMHSATTGLLTLEGIPLPNGGSSAAHRPLIIPEVRRPSLRAGSGSTSFAAPHASGTDHRLARRPSFVEGGSREHSLDAEFPALGNMEGRHAAQTFRWQQQHFGERSNSQRRHD